MVMAAPGSDERCPLGELDWVPMLPLCGDRLLGCRSWRVADRGLEQAACARVEPAVGLLLEVPRDSPDQCLLEVRRIATDAQTRPFLLEPGCGETCEGVEFNRHVGLVFKPLSPTPGSAHTDRAAHTERDRRPVCLGFRGRHQEAGRGAAGVSRGVTHVAMDRGRLQVQRA